MKRLGAVLLLLLFLFPIALGPVVNGDLNEIPSFVLADDGSESSESISSFAETLADDVLFYPDALLNDTPAVASSGKVYVGSTGAGDYTDTQVWAGQWSLMPEVTNTYFNVSVAIPVPSNIEGVQVAVYAYSNEDLFGSDIGDVLIQLDNQTWFDIGDFDRLAETDWANYTTYDPVFWNSSYIEIGLYEDCTSTVATGLQWAYCEVQFYIMTLADSDHYAESFADVSDWTVHTGESISSDGDQFVYYPPADSGHDYIYNNDPSIADAHNMVIEWRAETNASSVLLSIKVYAQDTRSGASYSTPNVGLTAANSPMTKKYVITTDMAVECVEIDTQNYGGAAAELNIDYVRIGPANEMGWQHDGSTTEGAVAMYGASISSDGDYLECVSDDASQVWFYIDTTATASYLEPDYYQFCEISFHSGDSADLFALEPYDGATRQTGGYFVVGEGVHRFNFKAVCVNDIQYIKFYMLYSQTLRIDYIKLYSVANWTVTPSGTGADDYLYVSSGVLNSVGTFTYFQLADDWNPAVDTSTYNVVNITTYGTNIQTSFYVGGWTGYTTETRYELPSGTLTHQLIRLYNAGSLSAITFIEDGTAPTIVRSSSTPNDPQDDEAVTLSCVVTDTVEVYTVYFDAIVYPEDFSDTAYYASEQSDNLWTYEFTTLDAGYYCFKIQASDGANTNSLTEYAYVELTVREAAIIVDEISLIGAGPDFTFMTFSARINRDCTYTIYEESASSPESDTHSGSVSAPSFNFAWAKLDVTDNNVNFTIVFVSGSLSYNYTSQYQVSQTTFYVEDWSPSGETMDTYTLSGRITKLANYAVYDRATDDLKETGSISALDFTITFDKWGPRDGQAHNFAIRFANGSQVCWINSTYYSFDEGDYGPGFPGEGGGGLWATSEEFWLLMAFFIIAAAIVGTVGGGLFKLLNLPNRSV